MKEKLLNLLEKRWFAYTFALCIAILFYTLIQCIPVIGKALSFIFHILYPVLVGLIVAYLLNPVVNFFERLIGFISVDAIKRALAVAVSVVVLIGIGIVLLFLVIPSLIKSLSGIIESIPTYKNNVIWALERVGEIIDDLDLTQIEELINKSFTVITTFVQNNVRAIVSMSINVGSAIFNLVVGFIIALYLLVGKKSMFKGVARLRHAILDDDAYRKQTDFLKRCHNIIIRYIYADLLDSLIVGCMNALAMFVFKLPFVPLISLIVGVTNIAPTFGPIVGLMIGGILLFLNGPAYALIFAIITLVIQIIDGYLLKPKLFGELLGVPPVWILISIIVAGRLFGVVGILLAIPFAAIVTFLYDETFIPFLERCKDSRAQSEKNEG